MSQYNSVVNFSITASNAGAIQEVQSFGKELDKLEAKKQKLAKPAAGKEISDRQFNKALKQDSVGDLFEGLGLGEKTLEMSKMVGMAGLVTKGFQIFGEQAGAAADKLRDVRDGQEHLTDAMGDFARQIPILGWAVKGFDGIREAITGEGREIENMAKAAKALNDELIKKNEINRDAMKFASEGAQKAKDAAFVRTAPEDAKDLARAQLEFRDKMSDIDKHRKAAGKIGQSGEVKAGFDAMEAEARAELVAAEKKLQDQRNKVIIDAATQTEKEITRRIEAEEKERVRIAKEAAEDKAREEKQAAEDAAREKEKLNADAMRASADLQDEIASLRQGQTDKLIGIGKQTRMGALAAGGGIGTANQLASQQRASFNPMIQLMQSAEKRDERKLKALEILADKALRGEVSLLPVFN